MDDGGLVVGKLVNLYDKMPQPTVDNIIGKRIVRRDERTDVEESEGRDCD